MKIGRRSFLALPTAAGALAAMRAAHAAPGVLRIGVPTLPIYMGNPFRASQAPATFTYSAIFDSLTIIDVRTGTLEPWLATAWEAIDPLTWRFTLRRGVKFSDGRDFDAEAVLFAFDYILNNAAKADLLHPEFAHVERARARDPFTVEVTLKSPDLLFARSIALLPIVHPQAYRTLGPEGFARAPVGTGPYRVVSWGNDRVAFEANPFAWIAPPTPRMEIIQSQDSTARMQGVLSGSLDVSTAIEPADIPGLRAIGGTTVQTPLAGVFGMMLRQTKPAPNPFQDVRVRRALNHAVDKQAIIDVLLGGVTTASGQPAPRGSLGHDPAIAPYAYDPAKAKALLQAAGYGNGFSFTLETAIGVAMADAAVYQQIALDLARVGITMNITPIPLTQFGRNYRSGDWKGDAFVVVYNADPTLDGLRSMRAHSCLYAPGWFCDRSIMPTIEAAFAATDFAAREALTREVMHFYHDQAASLFLYDAVRIMAIGPRLQSFDATSTRLRWDRMALKEAAR
jgi:peptide/nickel transport system substrate-binding protein